MFNSLRFRLTLIFVGLAIGPLVLVAAVVAGLSVAYLEEQSLALQCQLARGIGGELRAFVECVARHGQPVVSGEHAAEALKLAVQIIRSLREGPS